MTDHYDYRLRITVLTDPGPPPPPESTLRALEAYIGGMLTASGIHGAVTIEPFGCDACEAEQMGEYTDREHAHDRP